MVATRLPLADLLMDLLIAALRHMQRKHSSGKVTRMMAKILAIDLSIDGLDFSAMALPLPSHGPFYPRLSIANPI